MNTAEQVLATLHGHEGWIWDGDVTATNEPYNAEFWFDAGSPRLQFDHFIAGHLELAADEFDNPGAILREIDIEIARWLDERTEYKGCVDPDHGIGDHPCDQVLGKDAAAALRDTGAMETERIMIPEAHHEVVLMALNHFGTGQHPVATPHNLPYFVTAYVLECLERVAASDQVTADGQTAARAAVEAIRAGRWAY